MEEFRLPTLWVGVLVIAIVFVVLIMITAALYQSVREPLRRQSRRLRDIGDQVDRANFELDGINARLDQLVDQEPEEPIQPSMD